MSKNFAIIGCGGYVAPRHLNAIKETQNELLAALDKNDSVGVLDKYFDDVPFFTEFERFDRFLDKTIRSGKTLDYVSICSPNYLHDSHIRFALRTGANAICEKPLVINPWNLDELETFENETGKKIYTVLQLRLHPSIIALKEKIEREFNGKKFEVDLRYITKRGKWYFYSWKGDESKSGGVIMNIGIHFFDMLLWIFGGVKDYSVSEMNEKKASGFLELEKARVNWTLSVDKNDLPPGSGPAYRSIRINGEELEFSNVFADLHTLVYEDILSGGGFGIKDIRPSIELVYMLKKGSSESHSIPRNAPKENNSPFFAHSSSEIDENADIGEGTKIWHFSHIMENAVIGKNCVLGQNVFVGKNVLIEDGCKIQNNVSIYEGVKLEKNVFCGPSCVFTNVLNPRSAVDRHSEFEKTLVSEGATIGANSTIVCGVSLGKFSFVGAGAVVTKNVPDYALVVGTPAKQIGWVCECGEVISKEVYSPLPKKVECQRCKKQYTNREGTFLKNEDKFL